MAAQLSRGGPRAGWKVAFNVAAVQRHFGLDGWLLGALAESCRLPVATPYNIVEGRKIKLEAELALKLGVDVVAGATLDFARAAIAAVVAAIELVDYSLPSGSLSDIVAHSFFHAGFVVGEPRESFVPLGPQEPTVIRNGEVVRGPDAALRIEEPASILLRASQLLERHGQVLRAGEWVLCGSLIDPVSVRPGDAFEIDYGALGKLELSITSPARSADSGA